MTCAPEDDAVLLAALAAERDPRPARWRMLRQRRRELVASSRARQMTASTVLFELDHPNAYGLLRPSAQNFTSAPSPRRAT